MVFDVPGKGEGIQVEIRGDSKLVVEGKAKVGVGGGKTFKANCESGGARWPTWWRGTATGRSTSFENTTRKLTLGRKWGGRKEWEDAGRVVCLITGFCGFRDGNCRAFVVNKCSLRLLVGIQFIRNVNLFSMVIYWMLRSGSEL